MLPLRFIDRLKFFVERQFVRGAAFQLVIVAMVIGLISLASVRHGHRVGRRVGPLKKQSGR